MILHSDMNNFYASVEILYDPSLRDKPVAVAGDEEARHGIVLAKNDIAKQLGIRTGQVLWEARQQCPELVCVPAHYERYLAFSAQAKDIYTSYTDQVEPFGLDECWLDVTGSVGLFGEGPAIADDIRSRIRRELGEMCHWSTALCRREPSFRLLFAVLLGGSFAADTSSISSLTVLMRCTNYWRTIFSQR